MFSQWRHAVESLAQPPRSSQDASNEEGASHASQDSSIRTSLSSSSQLAESALSSLRKSLAAQRSGSPAPSQTPPRVASPAAEPTPTTAPRPRPAGRSTLEDRIRAKLLKDASSNSIPTSSTNASSSPVPAVEHPLAPASHTEDLPVVKGPPNPLSPTSAPLPDSPLASPTMIEPILSLHVASDSINSLPALSDSPQPTAPPADEVLAETAEVTPSEGHNVTSVTEDLAPPEPSQERTDYPEEVIENAPTATSQPEADSDIPSNISDDDSGPSPNASLTEPQAHDMTPDASPFDPLDASELAPSLPPTQPNEEVIPGAVNTPSVVPAPDHTPEDDASTNATDVSHSAVPNGKAVDGVDIEALQKRLKLVEQRFTDVSTSFKRLQAEKLAADRVLRELTSVESVTEADALRDFLQNMNLKTEMAQDEIRRLNGKLTRQEERIEELRDIHRLDSKSQSEQIDRLKAQVEEAEKLLKASQGSASNAEQESAKQKAEIQRLQSELEKATNYAKEEEEKRTKAIALLKTVRQKLVKAEKERDDALKEIGTMKDTEKAEREKEKGERAKLQAEIEKVNVERETAVQGLKAQFDKELAAMKERHEKEMLALRGQFELEAITAKTTHVREIENKKARISDLETTVRTLSRHKDELFDQLQLRQAELESSQSSLESLQGQNSELQYQLREANDRIALLQDEFTDVRREQDMKVQSPGPSTEEVTRLLAAAELKYETKLADLRRRLTDAERERDEGEAHWSKKLAEKAREVESLKAIIESSQKNKEEEEESAQVLQDQIDGLRGEIRAYQQQIVDLHAQLEKAAELETMAKNELAELSGKAADLQQYVDDSKGREAQLRAQNKTLREELRKVQASVALLEKQRGPGVGYWASRNDSTSELRSPRSSVSDLASRETPTSSRPTSPSSTVRSDEEVNFEYLRNVILQFLEHKEMRPHLIKILSTILRFTPQETRRLIAKV